MDFTQIQNNKQPDSNQPLVQDIGHNLEQFLQNAYNYNTIPSSYYNQNANPQQQYPNKNEGQKVEMRCQQGSIQFSIFNDKELGFQNIQKFIIPQMADEDSYTTYEVKVMNQELCLNDLKQAIHLNQKYKNQETFQYDFGKPSKAKSSKW